MNTEKRIISVRDMEVKFQVRGNLLTAIRNVNLDVYDQEILAIVGESGSGKSVITKTFTGMLEENGWVSNGSIVYRPNKNTVENNDSYFKEPIDIVNLQSPLISKDIIKNVAKINNEKIKNLFQKIKVIYKLNPKYINVLDKNEIIKYRLKNKISLEKNKIILEKLNEQLNLINENLNLNLLSKEKKEEVKKINKTKYEDLLSQRKEQLKNWTQDVSFESNNKKNNKTVKVELKIKALKETLKIINDDLYCQELINSYYQQIIKLENDIYKIKPLNLNSRKNISNIISLIKKNIITNERWNEEEKSFVVNYFVNKNYLNRFEKELFSICFTIIECNTFDAQHFNHILVDWKRIKNSDLINKINALKEIRQLRGKTISTIFQDPMTSLNPLLPVGFQITEVLRKQVGIRGKQAKAEAIELLRKVGIKNPEKRFKDIPGKYSGGMRQRVVIAIALAARPKILICDEPTTALDVTIQAQILDLIKQLQQEYKFSVIFITHDLGVVAKIADRVAVMYAGQIIEYGTTKEIFDDPKHPYTWALLSSLPQLGKKGEDLFSIEGNPPSLFNDINGDAFAPRNKFALELDYVKEPPMFQVTETHFAKTWLLDSRAPNVEKPSILKNLKQRIEETTKEG